MPCSIKKLIALFLAVWLPLFSGNALAGVVAMQANGGCHAAAMRQTHPHVQLTPAAEHAHHEQLAAHHDMPSGHHDQPDSSCKNHATCHLACYGYVANSVAMIVTEPQPDRAFTPYLVARRTLTLALIDPPPLARS